MMMGISMRRQHGLSLVELLVASAVGLLLTAGIIQIFVGNRQSYRVQEALSRLQENGRFALMFIERDIRMADYHGCGSRSETLDLKNTLDSSNTYLGDLATGIEGYEWDVDNGNWDRNPDASIISPMDGSDILTVRRASGESFKVVTHDEVAKEVVLNGSVPFQNGDNVMVSDCIGAAVFEVTSDDDTAAAGTLVYANDLGRNYVDGDAYQFETVSYFIRVSDDSGRPGLWRRTGGENTQELIEGVEELQILYGEDNQNADAVVDRYVTADDVDNWDNVISVSINLLLSTLNDNLTLSGDPQPYTFNGVTYDGVDNDLPNDHRLRRSFATTVTLRNRTL